MNVNLLLYILMFIVRVIVLGAIWKKHGWKAWGLALMYALLTVASELPEEFV